MWVGHRNRKQAGRVALGNQLLANVDLSIPQLRAIGADNRVRLECPKGCGDHRRGP